MLSTQTINSFSLLDEHRLEFGPIKFYENFLISELNEGEKIDFNKAKVISRLVNKHFNNKPFAYISNRINSYAVVPTDYYKIHDVFPNLKAFATVIYSDTQKSIVNLENKFLQEKLKTFNNLDEAITWTQEELNN